MLGAIEYLKISHITRKNAKSFVYTSASLRVAAIEIINKIIFPSEMHIDGISVIYICWSFYRQRWG